MPSVCFYFQVHQPMRLRHYTVFDSGHDYFDEHKIRTVANKVGAEPVIVPLYVGGQDGIDDYFALTDLWVNSLLNAAKKQGVIK